MPITLIKQLPEFTRLVNDDNKLAISEMFSDTLQGEGINTGVPATFIRMQGCTLSCHWCDTLDVWPYGNEYSFDEIFKLMDGVGGLINRLRYNAQHLVLTGGSPLKQQHQLYKFIQAFFAKYKFVPYIEVENECVLPPDKKFSTLVSCWNNSPKLSNSGMKEVARYKPEILKYMNRFQNSWFKFVISTPDDWKEIETDFLPLIDRKRIILMPEGISQESLNWNREWVSDLAIVNNVRYCDRLHIILWNKKTGV